MGVVRTTEGARLCLSWLGGRAAGCHTGAFSLHSADNPERRVGSGQSDQLQSCPAHIRCFLERTLPSTHCGFPAAPPVLGVTGSLTEGGWELLPGPTRAYVGALPSLPSLPVPANQTLPQLPEIIASENSSSVCPGNGSGGGKTGCEPHSRLLGEALACSLPPLSKDDL